jgi:hypothetical protein
LTHEEIHKFLEESRSELDRTFSRMIDNDRERSSSASSTSRRSSSSKRSREEDEEESDRASKRALRRISLRNKTAAFVTTTAPPSSSKGTEISFKIRIDTPPNTPNQAESFGKLGGEEKKEELGANEETVAREEKAQGGAGRGRTKSRAKNA